MAYLVPQSISKRVTMKAYLSDGATEATSKTIAITISKNGGAFGNPAAGATNATEIANGWYYVDLASGDFDTQGPLIVRGTATGVDNTERLFYVVNAFNAGFTGIPGVIAEAAGGLYTRGTGAGQINQEDNGYISVNLKAILRTALSEGATGRIAAAWQAFWNVTSPVATAQSLNQTGDSFGVVKSGGTGDNAAIKTQTDKLAFTVTNQIDANVLDWKSATAPAMTGDAYAVANARLPAALTGAGNIKADALLLNGATPNNLAAGAQMDLVNAPNATAITAIQNGLATPTNVWTRLTSALTTPGSIGKLIVDYLNATISSRATPADVHTSIAVSSTTAATISNGALAIVAASTFQQSVDSTVLDDLSTAIKIWAVMKANGGVSDAGGFFFIEMPTGLLNINGGATYPTPAHGSITVTGSSGDWRLDLYLHQTATALLLGINNTRCIAGIKALLSNGRTIDVWGDSIRQVSTITDDPVKTTI